MNRPTVGTHTQSGVPATAGTIAHAVIAELLTTGPTNDGNIDAADRLVRDACHSLGRSLNAKRIRALALTSVCKYLSLLRPTMAEFIGAEVVLNTGRADLVWLLADGDVFIDEIKTARFLDAEAAVAQAARYATAGVDMFGDGFAGVRVISTTQERRSLLVSPTLAAVPLTDSALAIPALRGFAITREVV